MHLSSWSGNNVKYVHSCISIDNQSVILNTKIYVYYSISLYKLTIMLTSMKNKIMNTTSEYSLIVISLAFMLTISPFGIDGNIDEKYLSSKNTKYIDFQIFFINQILLHFPQTMHDSSCSHFFPILLHRIFFMSFSPPLTSMSKIQ